MTARIGADHFESLEKPNRPIRGLLPHPQLDRGFTQGLGELSDLGLQVLLAGRRTGLASEQAREAA